jgi:hypothetical protein
MEESWRIIVHHCNGLPLAPRVFGSSLSRKSREVWESALHEMEVIPNFQVQKVLAKSYNSPDDDYQKNLFLILLVSSMEWSRIMQLGHLMGLV